PVALADRVPEAVDLRLDRAAGHVGDLAVRRVQQALDRLAATGGDRPLDPVDRVAHALGGDGVDVAPGRSGPLGGLLAAAAGGPQPTGAQREYEDSGAAHGARNATERRRPSAGRRAATASASAEPPSGSPAGGSGRSAGGSARSEERRVGKEC